MMKWTISDIPSQNGKVVVITGASAGIGRSTTKILASKGADIVLAVRNVAKGERVADAIRAQHPNAKLHVLALDLSSLSSVRAFAAEFQAKFDRLDVLINNVGIYDGGDKRTADGFALQMGVNHLGHFALTGRLLEPLLATQNSRVVTVSSSAYRSGKLDLDTFHTVAAASKGGYGNSKLANLLFTLELQRKLSVMKSNTISVAAGPGATKSDGARAGIQKIPNRYLRSVADKLTAVLMLSSDMGALPVLRAATDPQAQGGEYFVPSEFMGMRGDPVGQKPKLSAENEALMQGLWQKSAELTGVTYQEIPNTIKEELSP